MTDKDGAKTRERKLRALLAMCVCMCISLRLSLWQNAHKKRSEWVRGNKITFCQKKLFWSQWLVWWMRQWSVMRASWTTKTQEKTKCVCWIMETRGAFICTHREHYTFWKDMLTTCLTKQSKTLFISSSTATSHCCSSFSPSRGIAADLLFYWWWPLGGRWTAADALKKIRLSTMLQDVLFNKEVDELIVLTKNCSSLPTCNQNVKFKWTTAPKPKLIKLALKLWMHRDFSLHKKK